MSAGTYTVTITDREGCTRIDDFLIEDNNPIINPYIGQVGTRDTTVDWGSTVILDAGNIPIGQFVNYVWQNLSTLDNPNIDDANAASTTSTPEPSESGRYQFLLTATSADGCVDTGSVYLEVEIQEFLGMPTAFTPNGDGINDFYRPANIDPQFIEVFRIFNRWGQLLHEGSQWDGTYQNQEQPMDGYIYYIEYQQPGQQARQLRGEFTLIR